MEVMTQIAAKRNPVAKSNVSFFADQEKKEDESSIKKLLGKWEYAEIYAILSKWVAIFGEKLLCVEMIGIPSLEIVKLSAKKYADCQVGFSPTGAARIVIRVNAQHVKSLPLWQLLAHLCYTVVQILAWQNTVEWSEPSNAPMRIKKYNRSIAYHANRVGIFTDAKGNHIHYGKVKLIAAGKKGPDYVPTDSFDPEGKFEFREWLLAGGVECPESYDVPTAEGKKQSAKRENWKTKYAELEKELTRLKAEKEQLLFSMMDSNEIIEPKETNINEDSLCFAGKEIKKEDIFPICDFVFGKISSAKKGYAEKAEMVIAVNKQFPRSKTAKKFGIDPIKTGRETFLFLALKILEQEGKIEKKRIVGRKIAYFPLNKIAGAEKKNDGIIG